MPFQTSVNAQIAPGIKGGWASANPHASTLQPNTGDPALPNFVSWTVGEGGVIVGQFAFADTTSGEVTSAHPGTGAVQTASAVGPVKVGFVQRDQLVVITPYLAGYGDTLFEGQGVTLLSKGDVWAEFAAGAVPGQFVFAQFADGAAVAGNTTTAPTTTFSVTTTNGSPNLTAVGAGAAAGMPVTGTGIPAGAYLVSVDPIANTAVLSANATAAGTVTATATTAVLTNWRVASTAANGDIAKITVEG